MAAWAAALLVLLSCFPFFGGESVYLLASLHPGYPSYLRAVEVLNLGAIPFAVFSYLAINPLALHRHVGIGVRVAGRGIVPPGRPYRLVACIRDHWLLCPRPRRFDLRPLVRFKVRVVGVILVPPP